ncbi:MAG: S8 family serine peptidase [Candidatus Eisenbacteria bacterium]|nr:S8 family serine peptidase [Candidatus Eisenbacteria bacterium]
MNQSQPNFQPLAAALAGLLAFSSPASNTALAEDSAPIASLNSAVRGFPIAGGLTAAAASKIDPRLLLTMAQPVRTPSGLAGMGRRMPILGTSMQDLRYPVLIRSDLSDRELAALGAAPDSRAGEITTAEVSERDIPRLAAHPGVQAVEASYWLQPTNDVSVPEVRAPQVWNGTPGYTGQNVLFGLIDDGIDVNHQDFLDSSGGSRIQFIWDHFRDGRAPAGFNYGKEYTKQQIDSNGADEFQNTGGHGSHVAGSAVGDGSSNGVKYRGVAYEAQIVAVRNGYCDLFCYGGGIPPWGDSSTKGSLDAISYLLQKKQALGKPMVVNQSQGVMMGPHDGTTLLEAAYNNFINQQGLIICIAAGNDEESGWHGRKTVSTGQTATIQMAHTENQGVQPTLAFEGWTKQGDRVRWRLVTPAGETLDIDANMPSNNYPGVIAPAHSDTIFYWSSSPHPVNQQGYVSIYVQNRRLGAATGTWQLQATGESITAGGQVDVYLERNQYNFAVTGDALNLDAIVGMPGTTTSAITVASYTTKIQWASQGGTVGPNPPPTVGEISSFSSWGPRRDGAQKPDIAAPGEWIMSVKANEHQQNAQQTDPDGVHMIISGTSMATPHVAGAIALMLQKDPTLTAAEAKQTLSQTARHDTFTGTGWNKEFGNGKLDVKAAVDALGGGSACGTTSGDANQDSGVNVLDLVATVNDILGIEALGTGRACADIDGNNTINVLDVAAIVNVILGGRPAGDTPRRPVAWAQTIEGSTFRFAFDARDAHGLQLSYILPRGYEAAGTPRLVGAAPGTTLGTRTAVGQTTLLAYNPNGGLSADADRVVLEVPYVYAWEGGAGEGDFAVTNLILADRFGRELTLESEPSETEGIDGGVRSYLAAATPNPAAAGSRISYDLASSGAVQIALFDASGRRIRDLYRGFQMAGGHILRWDGRDASGREVPDGAYFVRLTTERGTDSQKLLVIK